MFFVNVPQRSPENRAASRLASILAAAALDAGNAGLWGFEGEPSL